MYTRSTRRLFALTCAAALTIAACGGDDDGSSAGADTAIGKALAADLLAESDSPISNEEEARCWSGQIVDGIGEDRLMELGVSADNVGEMSDFDFTDEEISTIVSSLFDCTDVRAALATQFEADFGAEGAKCLADEMDEDLVTSMMTSAFSNADGPPAEFMQAFLDIAAKCDLPIG
jgi:hypothetical protein